MQAASARKLRVGLVGATGMVGQRFVTLLAQHPMFELTVLAASAQSANKPYRAAVEGRWAMSEPIPPAIAAMEVLDGSAVDTVASRCDFIFCAIDLNKDQTLAMEEAYARSETPVVSCNSATRGMPDVPMLLPEVNAAHIGVIASQRARLGTKRGFIAVKPNCSIQSFVPALEPLRAMGLRDVVVSTYQAISGAGKTFQSWPEMVDNLMPCPRGEEDKSEHEPFKLWGTLQPTSGGRLQIVPTCTPRISAQCMRVPVSDGHYATVFMRFAPESKPTQEQIVGAWRSFAARPQQLKLPSAPVPALTVFEDETRPQSRLDRDLAHGMGISIGRLHADATGVFDYKFVCLSHNTLRGAAGGAVLNAELLAAEGFLTPK